MPIHYARRLIGRDRTVQANRQLGIVLDGVFVPLTVMLLCFIRGLQTAIVTKLSNAGIRTTHITGVVTDIGIELGQDALLEPDRASRPRNRERRLFSLAPASTFMSSITGL